MRGDGSFGNQPFIIGLEESHQRYLFTRQQTTGVKKLLARPFARDDRSTPGPADKDMQAWEYAALRGVGGQQQPRAGGLRAEDIERGQSSAPAVALVYCGWGWYCPAAKSGAHTEAITGWGLSLADMGRAANH